MQQQNVSTQRDNDTTPIQKTIIAQYIGSALSDYIDDSVGFNEGNKLKLDIEKDSLRLDIIETVTNPVSTRYEKLHELIYEPYKTELHQSRYGNVNITQNDVIKETERQLDELFDYESGSDKSFVKKANSFLEGSGRKLSDMAAESGMAAASGMAAESDMASESDMSSERVRQYAEDYETRWRDRIQPREFNLLRTSVTVGVTSGVIAGSMLGIEYNEDTRGADSFKAGRALVAGVAFGLFAGILFYGNRCSSDELNRRSNAENDNINRLELAERGESRILR